MPGILVGIDGSGHSQRALEWAMKEASLRNVPVTVLAVHPTARGFFSDNTAFAQDQSLTNRVRDAAQAETDKLLSQLGDARPPSVTVKAVNGIPVEELVNASRDADMLVLGSRGAGGFSHLRLGSTSTQVAHHAHCPVLIIPPDDRA
jgi:nucleotide-binding universal stress UspA family protein